MKFYSTTKNRNLINVLNYSKLFLIKSTCNNISSLVEKINKKIALKFFIPTGQITVPLCITFTSYKTGEVVPCYIFIFTNSFQLMKSSSYDRVMHIELFSKYYLLTIVRSETEATERIKMI